MVRARAPCILQGAQQLCSCAAARDVWPLPRGSLLQGDTSGFVCISCREESCSAHLLLKPSTLIILSTLILSSTWLRFCDFTAPAGCDSAAPEAARQRFLCSLGANTWKSPLLVASGAYSEQMGNFFPLTQQSQLSTLLQPLLCVKHILNSCSMKRWQCTCSYIL